MLTDETRDEKTHGKTDTPKLASHTRDFRRLTPDGHPMPTGTGFIPLGVLFLKLCFALFGVFAFHGACAAYAVWTTPGLVRAETPCGKLPCLYQVRVSPQNKTQVEPRIPCLRVRTGMFYLGLNPGHNATNENSQPLGGMGR